MRCVGHYTPAAPPEPRLSQTHCHTHRILQTRHLIPRGYKSVFPLHLQIELCAVLTQNRMIRLGVDAAWHSRSYAALLTLD